MEILDQTQLALQGVGGLQNGRPTARLGPGAIVPWSDGDRLPAQPRMHTETLSHDKLSC